MVSADQDVLWRSRWLIAASCVVISLAVSLLVATQAHRFVWGLFAWGLLVCVVGAAAIETAAHVALGHARTQKAAQTWQRRRPIYDGLWIFWGVVIGAVAASFDLAVVDLATTVYIVISFGIGAALVARGLRKRRLAGSG